MPEIAPRRKTMKRALCALSILLFGTEICLAQASSELPSIWIEGQESAADNRASLRELLSSQECQSDDQRSLEIATLIPSAQAQAPAGNTAPQTQPPTGNSAPAQTQQAQAGASLPQIQSVMQLKRPQQEIAGREPTGPAIPVGPARLRIGGYLGLTAIYRSTNVSGGTGTNFNSIPFENTVE